MGLRVVGVQRECLSAVPLGQDPSLFGTLVVSDSTRTIEICQAGVRRSIRRIQRSGTLKIHTSGIRSSVAAHLEAAAQICFHHLGPCGPRTVAAEHLDLQLVTDALRYLRLERERIANVSVEGLRPNCGLIGRAR